MNARKLLIRIAVWLLTAALLLPVFGAPARAAVTRIVDPLNDFSLTYKHSGNLSFDTSNTGNFGNDPKRAVRNTTDPGYVTYRLDEDVRTFTVGAYFWTGTPVVDLRFFVSPDGVTYTEFPVPAYPSGKPVQSWQLFVYEGAGLPAGTKYLKIQLEGAVKAWTPQISKVAVNAGAASVEADIPSGTMLDGPAKLTLATATPGAAIYYKRDSDAQYTLYGGPIDITAKTSIDAYAQADGLEPSYPKTFTYYMKSDLQVDRYGQSMTASFADKVSSDQELQDDLQRDQAYYGSLAVPDNRDSYGGLQNSAADYGLQKTGFFAIQQAGGRTVMTDPDGNIFFSAGVNGITTNETYTQVTGREGIYEWIPPFTGPYATAYRGNPNEFSYFLANRIKKYGQPYDENAFFAEAVDRLRKWGFNTAGAWSGSTASTLHFPYTKMLPSSSDMTWAQVDGMHYFDIFVDGAEQKIDDAFAAKLPAWKDDTSLIGYFMENEINFQKIPTVIPAAKASKVASKRRLVELLQEKYNGDIGAFNAAWNTNAADFSELYEAPLSAGTPQALDDMYDFIKLYADTLYGTVAKVFRKYDPNHLLLGDRWLIGAVRNDRLRGILAEAAGKYFDAISINYYSKNVEPDFLRSIHDASGGKPVLITEFNYGTSDQGLNGGVIPVETQDERQLRYRNFVEQAASLGFVIGTHWFNYVDQPLTGRWWEGYTGERYNTGLVSVTDRPYKTFLDGVKTSNDDIYSVLLGQRAPFNHDFGDPTRGEPQSIGIPYLDTPPVIDGSGDAAFDGIPAVRLTAANRDVGVGGDDIQAEYRFGWDASNLYVLAQVKEPTPMLNSYRNSNVWKGDGVELFVGPEDTGIREGLLSKDRQLIMSAAEADGSPYWRWFNTSVQAEVSMAVAPSADGSGYTLEAAVPWTALNAVPAQGKELLFDFGFDDSEDGVTRKRQYMWNGNDANSGNRGLWGNAVLTGPADRQPPEIAVTGLADGDRIADQVIPSVTANDSGSGVKSVSCLLDGAAWTPGTAITAAGPHVLQVTAEDAAGNKSEQTVRFTLLASTRLEAVPAGGQYSDEVRLQARLSRLNGEPLAGKTVSFQAGGADAGTAVTDRQGLASVFYTVDQGVEGAVYSAELPFKASFAGDESSYLLGSEAASALTVTREDALLAYAGPAAVSAAQSFRPFVAVAEPQDGHPGSLQGLPVHISVLSVLPDGTTAEAGSFSGETDASGVYAIPAPLPAGLYRIEAKLTDNPRYTAASAAYELAVCDPAALTLTMAGQLDLPPDSSVFGDKAKKLHIEGTATAGGTSRLRLHAEPQGKEWLLDSLQWLVATPDNRLYAQGAADSGGERWTVRIAVDASRKASLFLWKGTDTSGVPDAAVYGADWHGSVKPK
jgi:hypothetical protein